jgi:hypothetical protein
MGECSREYIHVAFDGAIADSNHRVASDIHEQKLDVGERHFGKGQKTHLSNTRISMGTDCSGEYIHIVVNGSGVYSNKG